MKKTILCTSLLLIAMSAFTGCSVQAKAPENLGLGAWGSPPPPASIPRADPTSKADLLRENQQLRQRVAWLDEQNRKSARKYSELESDKREIQADMAKIAAERDRYLRAAGR